jgi:hypothetical protein
VRCRKCPQEFLVAFSCRGRGLCPSCGAKRAAAQTAKELPVVEWRDGQPWNGDFRRSAKLIERYRNGRQVGSDGRTLWVLARRPGTNPAMPPTQIHRTQYEREGDWILAEGEE